MSAVVLISSSPPRDFACSPTPAESSSPLPSPSSILRNGIGGTRRFKPVEKTRDSFSGASSTPRAFLSTKVGAENIPLRSPGTSKFIPIGLKPIRDATTDTAALGKAALKAPDPQTRSQHFIRSKPPLQASTTSPKSRPLADTDGFEDDNAQAKLLGASDDPEFERASFPLLLEKALPRRRDWTPTKEGIHTVSAPLEPEDLSPGISRDLLRTFTYTKSTTQSSTLNVATKLDTNGEPTKRRRIDLVMTTETHSNIGSLPTTNSFFNESVQGSSKRRNKSPAKKALTITGLATSLYGESEHHQQSTKVVPMLEYLTATQVGAVVLDSENAIGRIEVGGQSIKAKPARKKSRGSQKGSTKSRLESPTSAMKAHNGQELLFGSASQLARDDSPTVIRDTLEALKRSEAFLSSSQISPQQTQTLSIEAISPRARRGTNRFIKRRNLWSAANRDEDNALLHVDTVDLTDSPTVRQSLTGKDVLLQPGIPRNQSNGRSANQNEPQQPGETPLLNKGRAPLDIDDIVTPGLKVAASSPSKIQTRAYHTSKPLPELHQSHPVESEKTAMASPDKLAVVQMKPVPTRPSYAGLSDHDLQKQLSSYGFKRVKKREKMIEILEQCWEDKHGTAAENKHEIEAPVDTRTHADFLTKVHDVSSRPVPKIKKPRAREKSQQATGEAGSVEASKNMNKPRPKGKNAKMDKNPPKKRNTNTSAHSEEAILDVEEFNKPDIEKDKGGERKGYKRKATTVTSPKAKSSAAAVPQHRTPATPPPSLPAASLTYLPAFRERLADPINEETDVSKGYSELKEMNLKHSTLTPAQTPQLPDIKSQIHAAIHFVPPTTDLKPPEPAPHSTPTPTWREKILLYDPIVIEDLTVWLNTKGFSAIGEDREVGPFEVREWCEENGVCCLWKGGRKVNRGNGNGDG